MLVFESQSGADTIPFCIMMFRLFCTKRPVSNTINRKLMGSTSYEVRTLRKARMARCVTQAGQWPMALESQDTRTHQRLPLLAIHDTKRLSSLRSHGSRTAAGSEVTGWMHKALRCRAGAGMSVRRR